MGVGIVFARAVGVALRNQMAVCIVIVFGDGLGLGGAGVFERERDDMAAVVAREAQGLAPVTLDAYQTAEGVVLEVQAKPTRRFSGPT